MWPKMLPVPVTERFSVIHRLFYFLKSILFTKLHFLPENRGAVSSCLHYSDPGNSPCIHLSQIVQEQGAIGQSGPAATEAAAESTRTIWEGHQLMFWRATEDLWKVSQPMAAEGQWWDRNGALWDLDAKLWQWENVRENKLWLLSD